MTSPARVAVIGAGAAGLAATKALIDAEELPLYQRVFHLQDPSLSFIGLIQSTGAALPVPIGPYLYSAVLAIGGFVSTTAGHGVVQSPVAQTALVVGITVVPAVLMVAAIAFQARCRLDRDTAS